GKRAAWACGEKMGALQPGTRPLRYTTLFRSRSAVVSWSGLRAAGVGRRACGDAIVGKNFLGVLTQAWGGAAQTPRCGRQLVRRADRKSTRLNSSHVKNSYAVFRLKKNSVVAQ